MAVVMMAGRLDLALTAVGMGRAGMHQAGFSRL